MCVPCRSVQPNARSGRRPRAARLLATVIGAKSVQWPCAQRPCAVRCGAVWLGVVYVDAVQIEHASAWCTCTRIPTQLWCHAASGVCWYTHHSAEEDHVDRNLCDSESRSKALNAKAAAVRRRRVTEYGS
jgi:hypothetical protein